MDIREFERLREVEYDGDISFLPVGEYFLMGESMIDQKTNKEPGDEVSVYEVMHNKSGRTTINIKFIKLENKGE